MMSDTTSSSLRTAAIFVFIGFLMTLGMVAETLLNTDAVNLYTVNDIQSIIDGLVASTPFTIQFSLAGLVFDCFFIIGYLSIFYALYVLTKERDLVLPKLAFALGFTTGVTDLVENAIHVSLLTGVPNGWVPDALVFSNAWTVTFVKDLSSYMAGMIFVVLLLMTLGIPPVLRTPKLVLTILLGLYVVLGCIAVVFPPFLTLRNLSFMIDMLLGSLMLSNMATRIAT
ncbi:MAG: hypothetical protein JSW61_11445 [Candidatus Thorarchaeota archaeon]|nr:MAG: hypothetical protein JSW61_11445 [Candidatus Thorarchaeota archaeon]